MLIGIPKELTPNENRVSAVPETVEKMLKGEMQVSVEAQAGAGAFIPDSAYEAKGANIVATHEGLLKNADLITKVQPPLINETSNEPQLFKEGAIIIAPLYLDRNPQTKEALIAKKMTAFSLERLPRIARAQSMDILSSMSNIAGYKSVLLSADHIGKLFPMMTTAAGTVYPAKVIVIGAGVAGLQAIATARRLGGVVIAFDTRPQAEEQVKSLGANFVSLETTHEAAEDVGGYAKEQTAQFYEKEQAKIAEYINDADVVITTALIPGKRAPILITEDMVKTMKPGSVIVDLAAPENGNCELTEPGKNISKYNVAIFGPINLASEMASDASRLYARNILAFLNYIAPQIPDMNFDLDDDIIKNCLVIYKGIYRN